MPYSINQKGTTLAEAMVAIGILSICTLAVLTIVDAVHSLSERQNVRNAAFRLTLTLTDLVSLPATIRSTGVQPTIPDVDIFWRKLRGWEKTDDNGPFEPMPLFLPFVERLDDVTYVTGGQLTGTPQYPLRYNIVGMTCDPVNETCPAKQWPIEVFTEYNFRCPPLFAKDYDDFLRDGAPFYGAIYPNGLSVPAACIGKSTINIKLTIRESTDPDFPARGWVVENTDIIAVPMDDVSERQ